MKKNDEELKSHKKDLDEKCELCIKYKRTKQQQVVGFPLSNTFNETMAMNLKEWSHDKKIFSSHDRKCFLCHSLVPPFYRGEWVRGWGGGGESEKF